MKTIIKIFMSVGAVLLLALQMNLFTSCNDDMAAESYYTFTGEMLDDYLKNREQFSMFREVVDRAGYMSVLHARGKYVMFPPTNEAMRTYIQSRNYSSVSELPLEVCDTLVREHLADAAGDDAYTDQKLLEKGSIVNWLEIQYLTFTQSEEETDENGSPYMLVNTFSKIIPSLMNDSCENGMVHPVDRVIVPSSELGNEFLEARKEGMEIFYRACELVGMLDVLNTPYEDDTYDASQFPDPWPEIIQSGFSSEHYRLKRPDYRLQGFTIFAVPDDVFKSKYTIDASDLDAAIDKLYELAVSLYEPVSEDLGITAEDKELYWKQTDEAYRNAKNPLNMFISYHILDRRFPSLEKFLNCWGTNTMVANPTEWVNTLLEHSSMKIERVYGAVDPCIGKSGDYYLNHATATTYLPRVPGSHVTVPTDNLGLNCSMYYVDDILVYGETMRSTVMNTRIRTDFMTLWPELTTNDIRLNGSPWMLGVDTYDIAEDYPAGKNYYMPKGYLKNVEINDDAIFFIMRPHNTFWGWGGDEINFLGPSYDCTFRIPSVPSGEYEVRIGISAGSTRGVAQVYFDGKPQGIPIDMRKTITDASIGGITGLEGDEILENNQTLKNNGYYRGPKSMYHYGSGAGPNHQTPVYNPSECYTFDDVSANYRIIICKVNITGHEYHTIRVKSVYSSSSGAAFMLDYLELVPNSICGVGGFGEDLY